MPRRDINLQPFQATTVPPATVISASWRLWPEVCCFFSFNLELNGNDVNDIFFPTLFLDVKTVLLKGRFSKVVRLQFDHTGVGTEVSRLVDLQTFTNHPCPTWSREYMWKSIVHREIRPSEIGMQLNQMNFVHSLCMCASSFHRNSPCPPSSPLSVYNKYSQFLWECIRSVSMDITCSCPGHLFVALGWWAVFASCQSGLQRTSHRYLVGISTAAEVVSWEPWFVSQVGYLNQGTLLRSSLDEVGAGYKKTDHSEVLERTCMEVELQGSQKSHWSWRWWLETKKEHGKCHGGVIKNSGFPKFICVELKYLESFWSRSPSKTEQPNCSRTAIKVLKLVWDLDQPCRLASIWYG